MDLVKLKDLVNMTKQRSSVNIVRFKVGDRCKVVKNLLAPDYIGFEVIIKQVPTNRSNVYIITFPHSGGRLGLASGDCLELID